MSLLATLAVALSPLIGGPAASDPIAHLDSVLEPNVGDGDRFADAIALSGNTLVVSAPYEDSGATGVDGDELDNSASGSGAVYVYERTSSGWVRQAYLKASNTGSGDRFGSAVAIDGDLIVVGAWREESSAQTVNGDQNDDEDYLAGAAYVFRRSGSTWVQEAYLKAWNDTDGERFGDSVAVSGSTIVVGASSETSPYSGVNMAGSGSVRPGSGAAYVFVHDGAQWQPQAFLKAASPDSWDQFGSTVAIDGDRILVGAPEEDSSASGVNGDQADNSMLQTGAVYLFARVGSTWTQRAYLKPSNPKPYSYFGAPDIHGDVIAVGHFKDDSASAGIGGSDQDDPNGGEDYGAVHLYRIGTSGVQPEAYVKASNPDAGDYFGGSVHLGDGQMLVTASSENSDSRAVNGDQWNNDGGQQERGALYWFVEEQGQWVQRDYLKSSWLDDYALGSRAALDGETAVGSFRVNGGLRGVHHFGRDAGFDTAFCGGTIGDCPCGNAPADPRSGCANSTGAGADLRAWGSASIADEALFMDVTDAAPGQTALLIEGHVPIALPFRDGVLCMGSPTDRAHLFTFDADGSWYAGEPMNAYLGGTFGGNHFLPLPRYYQVWYRDPGGPCGTGSNLTNALRVDWTL